MESKEFEHEDWCKNCKEGLLPASNILDCYICDRCGYDSRGKEYSNKVKLTALTGRVTEKLK